MEIGIEKCPLLVRESGKRHLTDGIEKCAMLVMKMSYD